MKSIYISHYQSPVGTLLVGSIDEHLCLCDWQERKARSKIDNRVARKLNAHYKNQDCQFNQTVIKQLESYFHHEMQHFDLPLCFAGTDFQKKVWQGLIDIPYGKTKSYGQLATNLGIKSSVRAVANANGANALSIIVPCHRIIGANGQLTGYAGGLQTKQFLLNLESKTAL